MAVEIEEKNELDITAEILQNVPDKYQKNVGYFVWDFLRAIGIILAKLWTELAYICAFWDIEKLNYDDLVKFVFQRRGLVAHTETCSKGYLKVSGTCNISEGAIFETSDGLQFKALKDVQLADGEEFEAECLTAGEVGNVPADTITKTSIIIQGLLAVTNPLPFTGGYEKETKENLLERYYEDLRRPITSGNIYHYEKWAKEVNGVGKVKVKPLWNGDNTVKVIVIDSNSEVANDELINEVQNYIDPYTLDKDGNKIGWGCGNGQAPIGAYCTVSTANKLSINISFEGKIQSGISTVKENLATEIKNYFKELIFKKDAYISFSKIGALLLNNGYLEDYNNLKINGDTKNIKIIETNSSVEIPILNELSLTEMSED